MEHCVIWPKSRPETGAAPESATFSDAFSCLNHEKLQPIFSARSKGTGKRWLKASFALLQTWRQLGASSALDLSYSSLRTHKGSIGGCYATQGQWEQKEFDIFPHTSDMTPMLALQNAGIHLCKGNPSLSCRGQDLTGVRDLVLHLQVWMFRHNCFTQVLVFGITKLKGLQRLLGCQNWLEISLNLDLNCVIED